MGVGVLSAGGGTDTEDAMTDAELSRHEWLEERAAILEFRAGYSRAEAERTALEMWETR